MDSIGAYFVTRAKAVMRYRVIGTMDCSEEGIFSD